MSGPVDTVLARLEPYRLNATGKDRWRAICPVCGERNPNTLSIGVGANDAVLLKCFKQGCSPEVIANALGLEITDLFPPWQQSCC
jgi:hypothetical protein